MNKKLLLECFNNLKHKFIVITDNYNYRVCGKGINKVYISNDILYIDSKCDDLKIPIKSITSVQIL